MTVPGEFPLAPAFDLVAMEGSSCSTSIMFCLGHLRGICAGGGSQRTSVGPSCPIVSVAGGAAGDIEGGAVGGGAMGGGACKDLATASCR